MIDFIKLKVWDTPTILKLIHNAKLEFKTAVSNTTGEMSNRSHARYKGLRIEYINYSGKQTVFIRGSLPQYYTGMSNYTNMPLSRALEGISALVSELELDMYCTEVLQLEWGLNFHLPPAIAVNRLIQNILVYKGRQPSRHVYERDGMMFRIDLNDFSIKIYNKSAQRQDEYGDRMRYELKVNRKPLLKRMGIHSLSDLFDKNCTDALQNKLLETIDHLIFYDYQIKASEIPARSKAMLLEYNNSIAWANLMQANPELYRKKKKSFAKGVTKASGVDWNQLLYDKVNTSSNQLLTPYLSEKLVGDSCT